MSPPSPVPSQPEPSVIASYHLSADGSTRELTGSLSTSTRFPIASVTKTLTALVAARLAVDGAVDWDEPQDVPRGSSTPPLTLRKLLLHTAGVPFELDPRHWHSTALREVELSSALVDPPRLWLPPGTWHYSNFGYGLAARVLERAAGAPYAALLDDCLLRPLAMTSTSLPDEQSEGLPVLGAAAPAGDLWSTLDDLMLLGRALDGARPEVVTAAMVELVLQGATPDLDGVCLAAGVRSHPVTPHRVLVSSGTIRRHTTCLVVWPRRGTSVVVAESGYRHGALRDAAIDHWQRATTERRSWWWDGQEVVEIRHGDHVELLLRETTWPFPLFAGRVSGETLTGVDSRGRPMELLHRDSVIVGTGMVLTADVGDSAHASEVRR